MIATRGFRRTLSTGSARVLSHAGVLVAIKRLKRGQMTIVNYHRLAPPSWMSPSSFHDLVVETPAFEKHVDYYHEHYVCLPLSEAVEVESSSTLGGRPRLAVTFDDGYWDNFAYARSILNRYGIRATFFVISGLVGSNEGPWYDRLARTLAHLRSRYTVEAPCGLGRDDQADTAQQWLWTRVKQRELSISRIVGEAKPLEPALRRAVGQCAVGQAQSLGWRDDGADRIMTAEELRQLVEDGHEIASHTRTHPLLPQLTTQDQMEELVGAKEDLQQITGQPVLSLAYPNGDYDDGVVAATRRAGYRCAVTTETGLNAPSADPFRLRRIFLAQSRTSAADGSLSIPMLELELSGLADTLFLRRWRKR